jgi:ribosomal-protein-alanine N-acetyltransferase
MKEPSRPRAPRRSGAIGPAPAPDGFVFRPMQEQDVPQVMRVERAAYTHPWTEGVFRDCLRVGYYCRVLDSGARLAGHGIMSVAAGECHLLNICIHPLYQRRGFGRALVEHLLEIAVQREASVALLEVRTSNRAAYDLYVKLGFDEIGMRKGYYPARRGREDAIILAREI